jgi:hypothetical protein
VRVLAACDADDLLSRISASPDFTPAGCAAGADVAGACPREPLGDFNDAPSLPWEEKGLAINHGAIATFSRWCSAIARG